MMKVFKIVVLIAFAFISIASAAVYIGEKMAVDKTLPVITIEEEMIEVSLKATDEELLKGVTAHDEKDGDLTDKIIIESISRFKEKGISKVIYAVCDSNNNVSRALRTIKYKGYESPKFKVVGNLCFSLYEHIDIRDFIEATDSLAQAEADQKAALEEFKKNTRYCGSNPRKENPYFIGIRALSSAFLYFSTLCITFSSTTSNLVISELCLKSASFTAFATGLSLMART